LISTGLLLASPLGLAQRADKQYRVGVLLPVAEAVTTRLPPIRERLATHGFIEGRNLVIEVRYALTDPDAARDLVARKVDAILAFTTAAAQAAQLETKTIPIVFTWVADPVLSGLVKHLGRPSGNITGLTNRYYELTVKRLELLRDLLPAAKRVVAIGFLQDPVFARALSIAKTTASRLGFELLQRSDIGGDWNFAMETSVRSGAQAACVFWNFASQGLGFDAQNAVQAMAQKRIPAVWAETDMVEIGGLMAHATNLNDELRQAVDIVARVLKGSNPGEIPVEQASRFELSVNLKTAKLIGIKVPQSILLRADKVIE
jgi:putative ABC transport system substrate-binding protein